MKKHGASHGLAVLVCTVTAGILTKIAREYYPQMVEKFESIAGFVVSKLQLSYPPEIVSVVTLAVFLAVIWGDCFFIHAFGQEKRINTGVNISILLF
ncbi:MAG: hypothetical protein ACOC90_06530 [Bacteroidota bacterium]